MFLLYIFLSVKRGGGSASLVIRQIKIKTTTINMTIIKKTITSVDENVEKLKPSYFASRNVKMVQLFWKTV